MSKFGFATVGIWRMLALNWWSYLCARSLFHLHQYSQQTTCSWWNFTRLTSQLYCVRMERIRYSSWRFSVPRFWYDSGLLWNQIERCWLAKFAFDVSPVFFFYSFSFKLHCNMYSIPHFQYIILTLIFFWDNWCHKSDFCLWVTWNRNYGNTKYWDNILR